jgi:hypothetical protein
MRAALEADDFDAALEAFQDESAASLCSSLISFLPSAEERVKSRAVAALGVVVARMADRDMEAARGIVRRLVWSLTEESGAVGWGAPEAIGEICARHEGMAREYASILLSYLCEPNRLDHPPLLRGALWGVARLAEVNPGLLREKGAVEMLTPYLEDEDADTRRLARRALSSIGDAE